MRIGELARRVGTDPPIIRYYEEVGLLPAPKRAANRYRAYGDTDVRRLELVLALRRLDVPVDEIGALAGSCFDHRCAAGSERLLEVIERRNEQVERQIEELRALADRFAELRRQLRNQGSTTMVVQSPTELASRGEEQETRSALCDCGCTGSGCTCGCGCCLAQDHTDHLTAVEVLAQEPVTACDCGCCG
jgi:DNA-binding transcriptional MerR regulator